jgi:hypothetical protein
VVTQTIAWPAPDSCPHVYDNFERESHRYYRCPDGVFPSVTTVLKVLGLSREGLIQWAVNLEREACLAAFVATVEQSIDHNGMVSVANSEAFARLVESKLGFERAHAKALTKAGDIGTQVHKRIQWFLAYSVNGQVGPCPTMSEEATRAYVSFTDWWARANLKPLRVEQPVWHDDFSKHTKDFSLGYAGTIDLIAEDSEGNVDVYDFKSAKGVYLEHHLQVRAYVEAARKWAPIRTGKLIRLPKTVDDAFDAERDIEQMGHWKYGKRVGDKAFSEDELLAAFRASLIAWNVLRRNPDFKP